MQIWFEWEREATVHPILICMEAWMQPTKKYCGKSWPTTYIYYKKDLVFWVNPFDELMQYGQYLLDLFVQPSKKNELEKNIASLADKLDAVFEKFERVKLSKLSESELLEYYSMIKNGFVDWFVPGALVEPIGLAGEARIRKMLEKKGINAKDADNHVSILTTNSKKTFSRRELEELLNIAIGMEKGNELEEEILRHAEKYFWLHNNYFTTEVLGVDFFKNQLISLMSKNGNPKEYLKRLDDELQMLLAKKKKLISDLKFTGDELQLIEFINFFSWYNDYRKEYVMKILHYLDLVLGEIGKRKKLTLNQMKYCLVNEIPVILAGKFDKSILDKRMNNFLAVWHSENGKFEVFTENAELMWKKIDPHINHDQEKIEFEGLPASRGIVTGRANVTMNASEAKNLKPGDVLVTSMTTPDFVTAMKKAIAVVTNEGGVLCHAAVISREFSLPCVVGTKIATKAIKTGDLIEVNGDQGLVKILKRSQKQEQIKK